MQYIQFRELMGGFTVFSLDDIRQADPHFHRRRLNEWQGKGYITRVINGRYIFADLALDEKTLFEIANRIYAPSYVSFEMALAFHGLIPESVYGITSASTRKTKRFRTSLGEFSYRAVRPRLYFGFEYLSAGRASCKIASAEKALLDQIYLHDGLKSAGDFAQLRLNREAFAQKVDRTKLARFAEIYETPSFMRRVKALLEYMAHARA